VYVFSDNIAYNGLEVGNFPTSRLIAEEEEEPIVAESLSCNMSQDITLIDLNPSSATMDNICEDHFGEMPVSFRALLKRYVTSRALTYNTTAVAAPAHREFTAQILPHNNMPYGTTSIVTYDLFSYLYYAYVGVRGGIRYRFTDSQMTAQSLPVYVSLATPATSFAALSMTQGTGWLGGRMQGSACFVPAVNAGIEVEFPYYSSNLFQLSFSDTLEGNVTDDVMSSRWYRNYFFDANILNLTAVTGSVMQTQVAAGEDFSFMRFQGAPYYTGDPII